MLEIKCPKSRVINEFIPTYYELQVQGQLEVCNLELCDYLECSIKEYNTVEEFTDDSKDTLDISMENKEKGVIIETFDPILEKQKYFYLNNFKTQEDITKWVTETISGIDKGLVYNKTTYWKLVEYNVKLIRRDKERFDNELLPEINRFWEDVLKHRVEGYESLIYKKPKAELNFLPDTP